NGGVWRIFIMGVDANGVPDVYNIIQDGPSLSIPYGDSIHPTPFTFVFDPPVHLPNVGLYEFAIQGEYCGSFFTVAADGHDDYPDGICWYHGRESPCEYRPRYQPVGDKNIDIVFQMEFCAAGT